MSGGDNQNPGGPRLVRQVSSVWAVQLFQLVTQLVYGIVSARAIAPAGFGAYATALSMAGLGTLLANAGVSNATARRQTEDVAGDRALASVSVLLSALAATLIVVLSAPWASLWSDPSAVTPTQALSLAVLFSPMGAVSSSIMRRQGRIATYNLVQLSATVCAILTGLWAVVRWQTPVSLTVLPVVMAGVSALLGIAVVGRRAVPSMSIRGVREDLLFSGKSLSVWAVAYTSTMIPLWSLSRFCGAATLGSWNRATVFGRMPFELSARSLMTVVFPTFRYAATNKARDRDALTLLMTRVAWLLVPPTVAILPAAGALVQVILGPGWQTTAEMIVFALVSGLGFALMLVLGGSLEAANEFRGILIAELSALLVVAVGALSTAYTGGWTPVAVAVAGGPWIAHLIQVVGARDRQLLNTRTLGSNYLRAALTGGAASLVCYLAVNSIPQTLIQAVIGLGVSVATALLIVGTARIRDRKVEPLV